MKEMRGVTLKWIMPLIMNPIGTYFLLSEETRGTMSRIVVLVTSDYNLRGGKCRKSLIKVYG